VADPDPDRALAEFTQLRENLKQGIRVVDGKQSLRTFAEYCYAQRLGGKETTKYDRNKRFRSCIAPILGDRRLCDITTSEISSWWETIQKVYAYNSAKQALSLLKRSLDIAVIDKLIPYNPAAPIKPRKPSDETEITQTLASEAQDDQTDAVGKVMTLQQVEALLAAVRGDWLEPLYVLAFLGARRGELLGFRWIDYDPKGKRLRIAQQVVLVGSSVRITTPKSTTSKRFLYVTDEHCAMLDRHREVWLARKAHSSRWNDDYNLIFCTRYGTPINPRNLLRHFYMVQERLGWGEWIETDEGDRFDLEFRFHDLRHTASQHMEDAGVQDKVRAAILGHANVKVTREVYTHASLEAKRDAIRRVHIKGT
jgi:integrase